MRPKRVVISNNDSWVFNESMTHPKGNWGLGVLVSMHGT